ncbi:MAG: carcinine hydrolase/isopenicillin-N N-acyltransferase family protein [Candidatus Hermodarchaeota archaeon]
MKKRNVKISILLCLMVFSTLLLFITTPTVACDKSEKSDSENSEIPSQSCCPGFYYATWKETNGQTYLDILASDHYQLGVATGYNIFEKILEMKLILDQLLVQYNVSPLEALYLAKSYELSIADKYISEMQGIAEGCEIRSAELAQLGIVLPTITYNDILIQNTFLDGFYGYIIPSQVGIDSAPKLFGCTAIAIKNSNRKVTIGQTWDFGAPFQNCYTFIRHKILGYPRIFGLRLGGMIQTPMGKTFWVTSTVNLVSLWKFGEISTPTSINSRMALENSRNAYQFKKFITQSKPCGWNYLISDIWGNLIALETAPGITIMRQIQKKDFVVSTNTYVNDDLKPFLLNPVYSLERQEKAEELTNEALNKDNWVSKDDLTQIFSFYDGGEASITRYPNPSDPYLTMTNCFYVSSGLRNGYFSNGNPRDSSYGRIPI